MLQLLVPDLAGPFKAVEPWDVVYDLTDDEIVPADEFLDGCPTKVSAQVVAVLDDVAEAPPPRYSGAGRWRRPRTPMMAPGAERRADDGSGVCPSGVCP